MYSTMKSFKDYLHKERKSLFLFSSLLLLVWMPWMTKVYPRIDMEVVINEPFSMYNWLKIGRQGGVFTRLLFGLERFNPLFTIIAGYLLICLAGILFGWLFRQISGKSSAVHTAFGLLCFTCPIMAEQFYFDMQIFLIAWAYILCAAAVFLSYEGILRKNWLCCAAAIVAMVWIFSTYQIFAVLYVVAATVCFVLLYQRWTMEDQRENPPYWKIVGSLIALFVIAFVLNTIISKLFFTQSNYLNEQIYWHKLSTEHCIANIKYHITQAVGGHAPFFTPLYGILALFTTATAAVQVCRKRAKLGWLIVLAVLALQAAPFLLTVYLGIFPVARAQLAYPLVLACNIVILFHMIPRSKLFRCLTVVLAILLCWTQTQATMRLIYTDQVRSDEDIRLASAVEQRIMAVSDLSKPVAFIGQYESHLNEACARGEIIGTSVFQMDNQTQPHYLWSTRRVCNITRTYGFSFISANESQILAAREFAADMPCWPAAGSVADAGEFTVVKLSEDSWPEELSATQP